MIIKCSVYKIKLGRGVEGQSIVSRDGLYVTDPTRCFSVACHWKVKIHFDIWILIMLFLLVRL